MKCEWVMSYRLRDSSPLMTGKAAATYENASGAVQTCLTRRQQGTRCTCTPTDVFVGRVVLEAHGNEVHLVTLRHELAAEPRHDGSSATPDRGELV